MRSAVELTSKNSGQVVMGSQPRRGSMAAETRHQAIAVEFRGGGWRPNAGIYEKTNISAAER